MATASAASAIVDPLVPPAGGRTSSRHTLKRPGAASGTLSRPQAAYLSAVVAGGVLVCLASLSEVIANPPDARWLILAAMTLLSGAAALRLPTAPVSFSISDSFTIATALLFGPAAGTLTVALDSLVISYRLTARDFSWRRLCFNATAPALAMWTAAHLFFLLAGIAPLAARSAQIGRFVGPLAVFATAYFLLNTWLIAGAVALEQRARVVGIWRRHFLGLWLTYFGGAVVAAILVVLVNANRPSVLILALVTPIPLILYVTFKNAVGRMEDQLDHLHQMNRMYLSTIETLAQAIDAKDQVTHGHLRRVQDYAIQLAEALGVSDEAHLQAIEAASLLHDLGKLAVPEHILNKPGRLTAAEFDKMKHHATIGADILSSVEFPYPVVPIVRHHHEHWNGGGYPAGLSGEEIPLGARILSVVDCFDALISDRPYRPRLSTGQALAVLIERSGTMYDPAVVAKFIEVHQRLPGEPDVPPPSDALIAITRTGRTDAASRPEDPDAQNRSVLAAFYDLGRELAAAPDGSPPVDRVHHTLAALMPAACTALFAYSPADDQLTARWAAGRHSDAILGLCMPLGQRVTGWVAANHTTMINSDAALDLGHLTTTLTPPPKACLSTAIRNAAGLVGALTIYSTDGEPFTQAHATMVQVIASRLASLVRPVDRS